MKPFTIKAFGETGSFPAGSPKPPKEAFLFAPIDDHIKKNNYPAKGVSLFLPQLLFRSFQLQICPY